MEPVDLRYLSVVAETGSLSNAAQSLGIKPSTISRLGSLMHPLAISAVERAIEEWDQARVAAQSA